MTKLINTDSKPDTFTFLLYFLFLNHPYILCCLKHFFLFSYVYFQIIHVSGVDKLKEALPNVQSVVILKHAGHSLNLISPECMAREIMNFYNAK